MSPNKFFAVACALALATVVQPFAQAAAPAECFVYIGTYTGAKSKGVYLYRMDMATGNLTAEGLAAETPNPTFLDLDPHGKFLYAADEINSYQGKRAGKVCSYSIDPATGKLTFLNERSTVGDGPCHILIDRADQAALIANYSGGSIAVLPIESDGTLGETTTFIQHDGKSVNADRQEKAHAHSMNLDPANHFVFVCDLGMDKVMSYRFDSAHGKLTPNDPPFAAIKPGSGPRHMAFSADGRFAYVINEMTATITVFAYDAMRGALHEIQTVNTLPDDFKGNNSAAEIAIHPTGKFLYGSNRGADSITVFAIDPAEGTLKFVQRQSVLGKAPRNFAIDPTGKFLLDANQQSDNLVLFTINPNTGKLTPTGKSWEVGAPVCVKFLPVPGK